MTKSRIGARGLVLGKFMPPHLGHVYLVDFARAYASDITVVVGTLAREPIPGALRFEWMRELAPSANVVHLTDENPQEPHEHPRFWDIWRESLLRVAPKPDYVFASEMYGARLARSARRYVDSGRSSAFGDRRQRHSGARESDGALAIHSALRTSVFRSSRLRRRAGVDGKVDARIEARTSFRNGVGSRIRAHVARDARALP